MSSDEESMSGEEYESEDEIEEEVSASSDEEEVVAEPVKKKGGKKGKKKDPNKPKRNMSAFFLYSNANRPRVKSENSGVSFGEVAKILSNEFKELPEKERKKWEKKAEKDKIRYQNEMKNYVPPSDDSDSDEAPRGKGKGKAKGKAKGKKDKDPNKPKRNQSAFFIYSNEVRSTVKQENPDAKFGDIAKIISVQFKALNPKDKKKYDKLAAKDKERYQREMAEYNA